MKYSLTSGGILIAVFGTLLTQFGFSGECSNELITNIPLVIGGIIAWFGRIRAGGVKMSGFKLPPNES